MSEESESYRLHMLRNLEHRYKEAKPSEVLEAEELIAKYRKEQARAGVAIARLREPLPKEDICPKCWYMDGKQTNLRSVPHSDPEHFDRYVCDVCGFDEERPTGAFR